MSLKALAKRIVFWPRRPLPWPACLAQTRPAFLIRRPEEIAASSYALYPGLNIDSIGLERLCEVRAAVRAAGGDASVVIDSDDLVARPGATMAAYCADVSASSGFERREHAYPHTVENSAELARFAAHHRPFYEQLYAQRLDVTPWEPAPGS